MSEFWMWFVRQFAEMLGGLAIVAAIVASVAIVSIGRAVWKGWRK